MKQNYEETRVQYPSFFLWLVGTLRHREETPKRLIYLELWKLHCCYEIFGTSNQTSFAVASFIDGFSPAHSSLILMLIFNDVVFVL
jgi:hypothetical protein